MTVDPKSQCLALLREQWMTLWLFELMIWGKQWDFGMILVSVGLTSWHSIDRIRLNAPD